MSKDFCFFDLTRADNEEMTFLYLHSLFPPQFQQKHFSGVANSF